MKRALWQLLLSVISISSLNAQEGAVLLSHFQESREIENQSWAICQDGENTMLFANRRGIMTFDGNSWNLVRMPAVPYSIIYNPADKRVYTGCDNNYGYLEKDEKGFYKYITLSDDSENVGLITRIITTDSTVWFYSETTISRHNIRSSLLERRFDYDGVRPFTGMFLTPGNAFINVMSKGLFRVEADTLFPIVTGYLLKNEKVLFCLPYDTKQVLLGMGNSSLSLFDGIKFNKYYLRDKGYLSDNILTDGIALSDSLYAFSTIGGGVIVAEKKKGILTATVNYLNGLPDDEVFAIAGDNKSGLWISHQYGLTRAALRLPVVNFSIYPGLAGNLAATLWHNNELYVSTSEGVFYLDEVKNYNEFEVLVKTVKPVPVQSLSPSQAVIPSTPIQPMKESVKPRKKILPRIFSRKEPEVVLQPKSAPEIAQHQLVVKPAVPQYVKKKVRSLRSVSYMYRKIDGLNEKCKQIVSTPNGILVSTNNGLFAITDHKARAVAKDVYVNYISQKLFNNRYYIATSGGYFYVSYVSDKWKVFYPDSKFTYPLYSITSDGGDHLWAGGNSAAYKIPVTRDHGRFDYKIFNVRNDFPNKYIIDKVNDTIFLFTESAIYYLNDKGDAFKQYNRLQGEEGSRVNYIFSQPGIPWLNTGEEWIYMPADGKVNMNDATFLKIFDEVVSLSLTDKYLWIISGNNQLFRIEMNKKLSVKGDVNLYVKSVANEDGINFELSDIVFRRGDNTVYFDIVAPGYYRQNSTQYQYLLEKVMSDWSKWSTSSTITLMPSPADYTLNVRAKDLWGNISEPKTIKFTITAPFNKTTGFYLLILAIFLIFMTLVARIRENRLRREKEILEEKVRERTKEIQEQKEEITSSIEYASRIQLAMLPMEEIYKNNFSDHFIFFKPRDIVSGDFYWIGENARSLFFTVADCTGHGVPGAFMSMLGISTLNEIITNKSDLDACTILNLLRNKIKSSLHQTGKEGEAADGMDIAFCILHKDRKKLEYAGAYNPMMIFKKGVPQEYKGDRMPIGIHYGEKDTFTNYEINVSKGDTIYIFSDGFCDQFGGPEGVKYKIANLKKLLIEINLKPMEEQKEILEYEFQKWRGSFEQVDDITILGVRI
jgi:serine phosphatase RsbU (regulator of sigma subunit)